MFILLKDVSVYDGTEYKEMKSEDISEFYRNTRGRGFYSSMDIRWVIEKVNEDFKHNDHPVIFTFYEYPVQLRDRVLKFTHYSASGTKFTLDNNETRTFSMHQFKEDEVKTFKISIDTIKNSVTVS